jgi:hypothetical protein
VQGACTVVPLPSRPCYVKARMLQLWVLPGDSGCSCLSPAFTAPPLSHHSQHTPDNRQEQCHLLPGLTCMPGSLTGGETCLAYCKGKGYRAARDVHIMTHSHACTDTFIYCLMLSCQSNGLRCRHSTRYSILCQRVCDWQSSITVLCSRQCLSAGALTKTAYLPDATVHSEVDHKGYV